MPGLPAHGRLAGDAVDRAGRRPGVLAACLAGAVLLVRRSRPRDRRRGFALVALVLTGCAVTQYVTAVYGEGNEVIKHMVIALFTASLAPIWLLAGALCRPSRAGLPAARRSTSARPARQAATPWIT